MGRVPEGKSQHFGVNFMKNTSNTFTRKIRFSHAAVFASLAMAAATVGSTQAQAAVICSSFAPISIPVTIDGVYANLVTGVTNTAGTVAGWDLNVYSATAGLSFFSSTGANNTTKYVGVGTDVSVLASGTAIDGTSTYATIGVDVSTGFRAGVANGYFGIAFRNEATATTNYGWANLTTTGPTGFPATLNGYCYQNDGTGINAGTMPVSLQSYSVD